MRNIANFVTYRTKFIRMLRNNCFAYDTLAYKQPIIAKKFPHKVNNCPSNCGEVLSPQYSKTWSS